MKIVLAPDPILHEKSLSVSKVDADLAQFGRDLINCMRENSGLGLSAVQVGRLIRVLCMQHSDGKVLLMYNPVLLQKSGNEIGDEGCLSYPGEKLQKSRATTVKVKYADVNNKRQFIELKDLDARVFQHELDHLNGKTFDQE